MHKTGYLVLLLAFSLSVSRAHADQNQSDTAMFETLFQQWTDSFNRKDTAGACSLFSKNVVADYRGVPKKNFASICDGFKKIFADEQKHYQYRFKLCNVYRSNDLAAVRITWYLTISENGKPTTEIEDQGMDVLKRDKQGRWQIVNYVGYQDKP